MTKPTPMTGTPERFMLHGKLPPTWVTSWPDWYGIVGNVKVIPWADFSHYATTIETENAALRARLAECERAAQAFCDSFSVHADRCRECTINWQSLKAALAQERKP